MHFCLKVGQGIRIWSNSHYAYIDTGKNQCWESPKTCNAGFSYCLWMKSDGNSHILGSRMNASTEGFHLWYQNKKMQSRVFTDNKKYECWPNFDSSDWNHVCSTWVPNTLKLYINGTEWCSTSAGKVGSFAILGESKMVLGETTIVSLGSHRRRLVLDEFIFWHKDVLSDQDIANLYNSY